MCWLMGSMETKGGFRVLSRKMLWGPTQSAPQKAFVALSGYFLQIKAKRWGAP